LNRNHGIPRCCLAALAGLTATVALAAARPEPAAPPDLQIELIPIKAGVFMMGSPSNELYRSAEEGPVTRVTITRDFWLGKHEVTRAQYEAIMGPTPDPDAKNKEKRGVAPKPEPGADKFRYPIVNVSWDQAMEFCAKLTDRERAAGRLPAALKYTLPTEAQWEYACRAGATTRHYLGDNDEDLEKIAWFVKTTGPFNRSDIPVLHQVGRKKPNAWGLHDMLGNVREWVLDWYSPYPGGEVTDPAGPDQPLTLNKRERRFKIMRGGAWIDSKRAVRCAARNWAAPEYGTPAGFQEGTVGFRVAVTAIH